MRYWIMKSEPSSYSIDDLSREKRTAWEGVRNYQARNYMRDDMSVGDTVFFYHSACDEPAITGLGKVCSKPYPDASARMKGGKYFDAKATDKNPRWFLVDVCFVRKLAKPITLREMRLDNALKDLALLKRGSRLSILPVPQREAQHLLQNT